MQHQQRISMFEDLPTFESDGLSAKQILLPEVSRGFKSARWYISTLNPSGHTNGLSQKRLKRELDLIHKTSLDAFKKHEIICNKLPIRICSTASLSIAVCAMVVCMVSLLICGLLHVLELKDTHSETDAISTFIADVLSIRNTIIICSLGGAVFVVALCIGLVIECKSQRNLENQYIESILAVHQYINNHLFPKYQKRGILWGIAVFGKDSKRLSCAKKRITFYSIVIKVNGQNAHSPLTQTLSNHGSGHNELSHSGQSGKHQQKGPEHAPPMKYRPSINLHDDSENVHSNGYSHGYSHGHSHGQSAHGHPLHVHSNSAMGQFVHNHAVHGQSANNVFNPPTNAMMTSDYDRIFTPSEGLYGSSLSMTGDAYLAEPQEDDSVVICFDSTNTTTTTTKSRQ